MNEFEQRVYDACIQKNWDTVERLLQEPEAKEKLPGTGLYEGDLDLNRLLGWAAKKGHIDIVKGLLEKGVYDSEGCHHAITMAACEGHTEILRSLVEVPGVIDPMSAVRLALIHAIKYGRYEVVDRLVSLKSIFQRPFGMLGEVPCLSIVNLLVEKKRFYTVCKLVSEHPHIAETLRDQDSDLNERLKSFAIILLVAPGDMAGVELSQKIIRQVKKLRQEGEPARQFIDRILGPHQRNDIIESVTLGRDAMRFGQQALEAHDQGEASPAAPVTPARALSGRRERASVAAQSPSAKRSRAGGDESPSAEKRNRSSSCVIS